MSYAGPYEMMTDVEQNQCLTCSFRKDEDNEYPMCYKVEGLIIEHEDVVKPLVMRPDGVVACTEYKPGDPYTEPDENQLKLL